MNRGFRAVGPSSQAVAGEVEIVRQDELLVENLATSAIFRQKPEVGSRHKRVTGLLNKTHTGIVEKMILGRKSGRGGQLSGERISTKGGDSFSEIVQMHILPDHKEPQIRFSHRKLKRIPCGALRFPRHVPIVAE